MAGFSDKPFRFLAKKEGAGLVFTEMVSSKGLVYGNRRTLELIDLDGEDYPVAVQLFGKDPVIMGEAASMVIERGADIIDINMGCPTPKIVKNGEGAALMLQPEKAKAVMRSVVSASNVPVTVKLRKGWEGDQNTAKKLAQYAEEEGIKAVTVHGRTCKQQYSGRADWNAILQVVKAVKIPVVGNGDIWEPDDAKKMFLDTGCAAVMVARGALGNPWIFSRILALLDGKRTPPPSPKQKLEMARTHLSLMVAHKGEKVGIKEIRKHLGWYFKGLKHASFMRKKVNSIKSYKEIENALYDFEKFLL